MAAEEDDDSHIIASVRRILGEDASRPRALHGGGAPPPDVYELEPSMMIEPHPAPPAEPMPDDGELSPDLAAWASEWGEEEEAPKSDDVSVVPQAAPMLEAQEEARHVPLAAPPPAPEPVRDIQAAAVTTSLRAAPSPAPVDAAPDLDADHIASIVEPQTADAAGHAFGSLRDTLRARKDAAAVSAAAPVGAAISSHAGGPTIEEMIRQELRPLLKSWLDAQLPELVERVVRAEIARIVEQTRD